MTGTHSSSMGRSLRPGGDTPPVAARSLYREGMATPVAAAPGRIPFWAHQLAELLLGLFLMTEGARRGGGQVVVPVVMGAVVVLGALVTRGPLAAWPMLSRGTHRALDVVVAIVAAASPLALGVGGATTVVGVELLAVVLAWLVLRTAWAEPPPRSARRTRTADRASDDGRGIPARSERDIRLVRRTGYLLGKARAQGPHRLGRAIGRARRRHL